MQLGMIGLGRMGANIVRRLMRGGHYCVVFDRNPAPGAELAKEGAKPPRDLADLVAKLAEAPRRVGHASGGRADRRDDLAVERVA